ncbi:hypothetical protein GGH91_001604 [Coemansia sp. RSA 2671]|uniref:Protein Asterix n=1 Tax=Coemansia spiralis TaxID=417178 RepID=A0A9W8GKB5_9FUNG|nr:hypothetical protein LPJ60_004559 [Coemansia sp. RSA 2675]KAJ2014150.1 hypothetical protein GGI06_003629 [Coemansia sp. S85]KAJ2032563.1 Protein Asterix [Coemansia sp. S610]KAJ2347964.1 hypothetical protein GGH91_001604 [Coemansia sp. RSA 2671]KAJ2412318.1 hypothetical protein GGI10_003754 [Coemansia sp. RSA 2530]KAJ2691047.1 Protein Asterix [Coemansia spiralis]KAJ2701074.1 Protein Asterix [Coemansia sp. IMI 209128]
MARKEFPGDPRRSADVVPYTPATSNGDGSIYYMVAFVSSMATLFLKNKWAGWIALYASLLSIFSDRASASSSGGGSRLSTVVLALTALLMSYMPEVVTLFKLAKQETGGVAAST